MTTKGLLHAGDGRTHRDEPYDPDARFAAQTAVGPEGQDLQPALRRGNMSRPLYLVAGNGESAADLDVCARDCLS